MMLQNVVPRAPNGDLWPYGRWNYRTQSSDFSLAGRIALRLMRWCKRRGFYRCPEGARMPEYFWDVRNWA